MPRIFKVTLLLALMVGVGFSAPRAVEIAGVDYPVAWQGSDGEPNSSFWVLNGTGGTTMLAEGRLILDTLSSETVKPGEYYYHRKSGVSAEHPQSILTFRARVDSIADEATAGAVAGFQAKDRLYRVALERGGVGLIGGEFLPLDTAEFHTYRLVVTNGEAVLYVDADLTPRSSSKGIETKVSRPALYFGVVGKNISGRSEWEYIAFINESAHDPERILRP